MAQSGASSAATSAKARQIVQGAPVFHVKPESGSAHVRGLRPPPAADLVRFARRSCSRDREGAGGFAPSVSATRSFRASALAFEVSDQKRERRWRDAIH